MSKKRVIVASVAAVISSAFFISTAALAGAPYLVTSDADTGAGTLREGLGSGATVIEIDETVTTITISGTLFYDGVDPLEIVGTGQTIDGGNGETLLEITMGADLMISDLTFDGGGGYDVNNQGGGKGIFVDVPVDREGVVSLMLTDVTVMGVGEHGVHVSDCDLPVCGAGGGGGGDGSPASVHAMLSNVTIDNVGYGNFDADGFRIDDRGEGDILFEAVNSTFSNVGADGVELDEGDNGSVIVDVRNSTFSLNGGYCADIDEATIPDEETEEPGTADDRCLEWDDDDKEYVLDLDDGFDIDEAHNGNIIVTIDLAAVDDNLDEGLDFDEEGQGNVNLKLLSVLADNNGDETIKVDEENGGNINAQLRNVSVTSGGDDGIQLEAAHAGQLHAQMRDVTATNNKKYGVKLISSKGWLKLKGDNDFTENGNGEIDLDGVDLK